MVNYDDEPLFHVDSVDKQILMVSDEGGHIKITNDDIIGESFELTESLCSEENLRLNSVESSQIKFRVKNTFPNLYRVWFTVTITMDGAEEPFLLGKYKVWKDKVSSDRDTREITAYDGLYKILTNTYKKWYNEFWSSRSTATMKQFRDAYFTRLQVSHPWISQQSVTLVNDGVILKKSTKIKKISGKDILGTICELNGVCGRIGRDNKFHYIEINKPATVYTIDNSLNIVDDYEDYNTTTIDRVEILSQNGDVLGASGEEQDEAENTYTIENGFLLKGLGNDDDARIKAVSMAQGILTKINNAGYIPFEGEFKGNPCYEVGDRIRFTAHGNNVDTLILNRTMRGVQSLHDVYSATGDDTYPDNTNTYSSKTKEIDHKLGDLDSEVGDINTKLENAPTFEINDNGTVSVSTSNNKEGSYIRTFQMIMYHPYPEHVIPAPYYQIWEVTVHSTSGIVLCFAPQYYSGDARRTFTLNGKTYYDTIVNIVTTSENSYVTQKWVGGIPMSSGHIFCPYSASYEWDQPHYLSHYTGYGTVTDSPYYDLDNGGGTLIYDTYSGTASTDRSFVSQSGNYQGTYYYAMVNENVNVPGTGGRDVKTLPTASDGYDLANSAESLAKATQGQTYERETPGFTGEINVMPTESIQTVTKSLDTVRENLPEANPTGEATATATTLKLNGTIYNLGGGGASALSELTDVELTDLADGEILKYDATEEKWVNAEDGGGGGSYGGAMSVKRANWIATSSSASGTRLTDILTLDAGQYLLVGHIPYAGGTDLFDFVLYVNGSIDNNSRTVLRKTYDQFVYSITLTEQSTVYLASGTSTSVSWNSQYIDFGGLDAILLTQLSPIIYSLEEREIGVWTDGKPLYQKTWDFGSAITVPSNTWTDTLISNTNISGIISIKGHNLNRDKYTSWNALSASADSGNYVKIQQNRNDTISIRFLTLQYTKTTDVAGSGSYAQLGVPSHHYSTNEHVVGTWIDGNTLYEKTQYGGITFSNSWQDTAFTGIDKIANVSGYVLRADEPIPFGAFNDGLITSWILRNNTIKVCIQKNSYSDSITLGAMTVQYTKTS